MLFPIDFQHVEHSYMHSHCQSLVQLCQYLGLGRCHGDCSMPPVLVQLHQCSNLRWLHGNCPTHLRNIPQRHGTILQLLDISLNAIGTILYLWGISFNAIGIDWHLLDISVGIFSLFMAKKCRNLRGFGFPQTAPIGMIGPLQWC